MRKVTHYFLEVQQKNAKPKYFGVPKQEYIDTAIFVGKMKDEDTEPVEFQSDYVRGEIREVEYTSLPTVEELSNFPAQSNPFHYDAYSMGTDLVRGWMAMHDGFDNKENPQPLNGLILINTRTGQRFRINLQPDPHPEVPQDEEDEVSELIDFDVRR